MLEDQTHFSSVFQHPFFPPWNFTCKTPCPNAILAKTEHDLQETVLFLQDFTMRAPTICTLQPTSKRINLNPCSQAEADSFQDNGSKDTLGLKNKNKKKISRLSISVCDSNFSFLVETLQVTGTWEKLGNSLPSPTFQKLNLPDESSVHVEWKVQVPAIIENPNSSCPSGFISIH